MVSCCSAVLVSGRLAWAAYMGRSCQAAWQGRWLHLVVKLLGGRVHIVSWVVKMTGDIEQAVACCSDCKGLALHCCSAAACLLAVPSPPSPSGFPCSSRFLELRW